MSNYYNGFAERSEAKDKGQPVKDTTNWKIASYFTVIIPLIMLLPFCIAKAASLIGRVGKQSEALVKQDEKVQSATSIEKKRIQNLSDKELIAELESYKDEKAFEVRPVRNLSKHT